MPHGSTHVMSPQALGRFYQAFSLSISTGFQQVWYVDRGETGTSSL